MCASRGLRPEGERSHQSKVYPVAAVETTGDHQTLVYLN
jgi:hypothetical protein